MGDYEATGVDPDAVKELIDKGKEFLAAASRYLEQLSGPEKSGEGDEG